MLFQLISRARRRLLCNAVAAEAVRAASVTLALFIVLLLLGTDILGWFWLIAIPGAVLAAGIAAAIRRVPGAYRTAQLIDTRLRLADLLSTAVFFSRPEAGSAVTEEVRQAQRERANQACRNLRASNAIPFRRPRLLYAAAPLALMAGSLFLLRYAWEDHLDLHQPLPLVSNYLLRLSKTELAELFQPKTPAPHPETARPNTAQNGAEGKAAGKRAGKATPNEPSADQQQRQNGAAQSEQAKNEAAAESGTQEQQQQQQQGSASREGGQEQSGQRQGAQQQGGQQQQGASGQASDGQSSSLISKLSDAMRNMLSRLGPQSSSGRSGQTGNANRQGGRMQQGRNGQSASQPNGGQMASAQGSASRQGQPGASAKSGGNQGEGSDKQQGSSAGSEEGTKDIQQAQQLAAMGKISVILGKRSENITGNTSIDTVSGQQTLVTPYARARDAHTESEARIDRDEVPVFLQDYVQRYFAAVRSRTGK